VDSKGEASFADVIPGKYEFVAGSANERYSVVRILSEAGTNFRTRVTVPSRRIAHRCTLDLWEVRSQSKASPSELEKALPAR